MGREDWYEYLPCHLRRWSVAHSTECTLAGTFTNVDRTVHLSKKAVEPPGQAWSDMKIFAEYAKRMGFEDKVRLLPHR